MCLLCLVCFGESGDLRGEAEYCLLEGLDCFSEGLVCFLEVVESLVVLFDVCLELFVQFVCV